MLDDIYMASQDKVSVGAQGMRCSRTIAWWHYSEGFSAEGEMGVLSIVVFYLSSFLE